MEKILKKRIIWIILVLLFVLFFVYLLILWFCPEWIYDRWKIDKDGEVHALLYFFSGVATAGIFFGSWHQLETINLKNKADFLLEIDRRWCSKEITAVRVELWEQYLKANKRAGMMGCYVLNISDRAEKNCKKKDVEHLFQHLNFLELLGAIGAVEYLDNEELKTIFGGKLELYLSFYKAYFDENQLKGSNAAKLLEKLENLKKEKKNKS